MKKVPLLLVLIVVLMTSVPALADGKFYVPEEVPLEIPYQRALLLFDGEQETLIVQSKYQMADSTTGDSLGWIVPVPSVPELASMDPQLAHSLFSELSQKAWVEHRSLGFTEILLLAIAFVPLAGSILTLLACWLSFYVPAMRFVQQHRKGLIIGAFLALVPSACAYVLFYITPHTISNPFPPSVEVIKAEQVGIYDVQVIKSHRAQDLVEWLTQNRFRFDEEDTRVFDEYLRRGWCFVVARIDRSSGIEEATAMSEGLAAPLIMRFDVDAPVYPLALTSTSGHETQVLLYLLSEQEWQDDGRMGLQFAGRVRLSQRDELRSDVEPAGFFSRADLALPYLCKFKATLTPEQMRQDLVFTSADDG